MSPISGRWGGWNCRSADISRRPSRFGYALTLLRVTGNAASALHRFNYQTAQARLIARILEVGPGQALAEVQFFAPSRGAERRQTRGCAKPPMGGRRSHPV